MVPRHDEQRRPERAQEVRRRRVLGPPPAVREIAGGEHERRVDPLDELCDRSLELGLMEGPSRSDMEIRDVKDAC